MTTVSTTDEPTELTSVYAAGAVLWRQEGDKIRVLVIHRDRHRDHSLAKGKVDPGETLPETAAREVLEETGYPATLGAPLGSVEYDLPSGRRKEVHYWTAEVTEEMFREHPFTPNDEVDRVEWLSVRKARKLVSYELDRDVLDRFQERVDAGTLRTFAVIALRHAKAVPPLGWPGDDASRPLTARGVEQAELVVPILRAFSPQVILSSDAVRCTSTVRPLAEAMGIEPRTVPAISQNAYDDGGDGIPEVVRDVVASGRTTVLCSHSPVIPEIAREIALAAGSPAGAASRHAMLSTAECVLVHLSTEHPDGGIVAIEEHGPLV
ncbi:NUDIX hydrolase [Pseudoclavibacter chungangensis]|uniref:NUDIX hydrolase n=1 Tax=Pseudoclavibacter chungangensis TaxID=587635 RepID=A0A7J5C0B1_9MICO|nr:NUDIX domain-containing protein [Pseudoclavibacter chungangensis]KAB1660330.1 NUDIX hydrolase [Pseudoclavibacter chungangensis]NYJ65686.1 8-oxo-dGTP diphosphatase [Pseudoclavibacter chungangensis]